MQASQRYKRKPSASASRSTRAVRTYRHRANPALSHRKSLRRILQILRAHLPELSEEYSIKSLGVFGSYVRHAAAPHSDVDVLIEFQGKSPSLLKLVHLENEMSDLLGIKVDLIEKKTLKPRILENVVKEVVYV